MYLKTAGYISTISYMNYEADRCLSMSSELSKQSHENVN